MSLYLIVFAILLVFAIFEYKKKETQKVLYWIAFGILTAVLVLRYGQGTDYFGYYVNYKLTPTIWNFSKLLTTTVHGEPGWLFVCAVFRGLNIPFQVLIILTSLLTMYGLHRFLSRHSSMMTVSLLLAYPTIYLTYAMSSIRQAIVLAVFLGFLLDWLREKKYIHYIVGTLLCALFHSSALVFLVLFATQKITVRTKLAVILIAGCTVLGFCSSRLLLLFDSLSYYAEEGLSVFAIGERLVSTAIIVFIFRDTLDSKETSQSSSLMFLLQVYLYGSIIYCFLMWNALLSARFAMYFKAVELALFASAILSEKTVWKVSVGKAAALFLLVLTTLMYFKNINSYLEQNDYFDSVNVFNYPYFSIFNTERVQEFMTIPDKYVRILGS